MRFLFLLFFTLTLYPQEQFFTYQKREYLPVRVEKSYYNQQNYAMLSAFISGDKRKVKRSVKAIFRKYGFIHLLTPSGIHLSSILVFAKAPHVFINLIIFVALFFYISSFKNYYSMERVLIFKIIYGIPKKYLANKLIFFFLTMLISIGLGHYSENPLSYVYSFQFWGIIFLYEKSKLKLIFYLFLSQLFLAYLSNTYISPLGIIVNPFVTAIFSPLFPLLIINNYLSSFLQFNSVINWFFEIFHSFIYLIDRIDFFPLIAVSPMTLIFLIFILKLRNKFLLIFFCFIIQFESRPKISKSVNKVLYSPLSMGKQKEFSKRYWKFADGKCINHQFKLNCKKKPLKKMRGYNKKL